MVVWKMVEFALTHFEEVTPLGSDLLIKPRSQIDRSTWETFLDALGQATGSQPWVLVQGPNLYLVTHTP